MLRFLQEILVNFTKFQKLNLIYFKNLNLLLLQLQIVIYSLTPTLLHRAVCSKLNFILKKINYKLNFKFKIKFTTRAYTARGFNLLTPRDFRHPAV